MCRYLHSAPVRLPWRLAALLSDSHRLLLKGRDMGERGSYNIDKAKTIRSVLCERSAVGGTAQISGFECAIHSNALYVPCIRCVFTSPARVETYTQAIDITLRLCSLAHLSFLWSVHDLSVRLYSLYSQQPALLSTPNISGMWPVLYSISITNPPTNVNNGRLRGGLK